VLFIVALAAQEPAPEGTVRGTLVDRDDGPSGDLSVRAGDHRVHCFRFDAATAVERDGGKAALSELNKGDTVEVIAGAGPYPRLRHARLVRVLDRLPAPVRVRPPRRAGVELRDDLFPRGNLTLSGVVKSLHAGRMVLATRSQGESGILLRDDTRYFADGVEAAFAGLRVNARVFVRAGRNLDQEIEAYQVMWGGIFQPGESAGPKSRSTASGTGAAKHRPAQDQGPAGAPDWNPYSNQLLY